MSTSLDALSERLAAALGATNSVLQNAPRRTYPNWLAASSFPVPVVRIGNQSGLSRPASQYPS